MLAQYVETEKIENQTIVRKEVEIVNPVTTSCHHYDVISAKTPGSLKDDLWQKLCQKLLPGIRAQQVTALDIRKQVR